MNTALAAGTAAHLMRGYANLGNVLGLLSVLSTIRHSYVQAAGNVPIGTEQIVRCGIVPPGLHHRRQAQITSALGAGSASEQTILFAVTGTALRGVMELSEMHLIIIAAAY